MANIDDRDRVTKRNNRPEMDTANVRRLPEKGAVKVVELGGRKNASLATALHKKEPPGGSMRRTIAVLPMGRDPVVRVVRECKS